MALTSVQPLTFQELLFTLQKFWAEHGCVLSQPYDLEVGAGTMSPDTFLRVLGPKPISIAYAQPSRRPADGRYGQEITQFTYFQQCGGMDLDPISGEITYGLERIAQFLQDKDSIYDIVWTRDAQGRELTYGDVRLHEEQQFSAYSFDYADVGKLWEHLNLYEAECKALLERAKTVFGDGAADEGQGSRAQGSEDKLAVLRFPTMGAYELALKCSHTFNLLDARGAISVTERVGLMGRIRNLVIGVAKVYAEQGRLTAAQ
jgi:glycyl-tRNA synthetase alpha chain